MRRPFGRVRVLTEGPILTCCFAVPVVLVPSPRAVLEARKVLSKGILGGKPRIVELRSRQIRLTER